MESQFKPEFSQLFQKVCAHLFAHFLHIEKFFWGP